MLNKYRNFSVISNAMDFKNAKVLLKDSFGVT